MINGVSKGDSCKRFYNFEEDINNVTLIFNQQLESNKYMFLGCDNIKEINLSEYDNSKVKVMWGMFRDCINLEKITFGNINTSLVEDMHSLFYNCTNLTSIDLSKFDTTHVTHMGWLFYNCISLTTIDLYNFNTSNVESMYSMFANCENINSLSLSNFNTSKVTQMCYMFYSCKNLAFLDLSNFDTSKVTIATKMFDKCISLTSLDFNTSIINITNETLDYEIYENISPKIRSCMDDPYILRLFGDVEISNCSDICYEENIKIDTTNGECIKSCKERGYNHEFNNRCYNNCPNGTHISYDNNSLCIEDQIKCEENFLNKDNCSKKIIEGYYYDKSDGYYKMCFHRCKYCYGPGNEIDHNCTVCRSDYKHFSDSPYKNNCYKECPFYYYYNVSNNLNVYKCTDNKTCPEQFKNLIASKKKCIDKCKNDKDTNNEYIYEYNNICYKECPKGTIYNETNDICILNKTLNEEDKTLSFYQERIADGSFDELIQNMITENGTDLIIPEGNITIQITTSDHMKNNKNRNISTLDLGRCENILRKEYKINNSIPLIIYKVDFKSNETLIPIIGYEIYNPLDNSKLNLSLCNEALITLNVPVSNANEDELYLYDPNSAFYNDICFSYTTENGTDILITDRIDEFIKKNLSLCESDCKYEGYNTSDKQSTCNCKVKNEMEFISDIINNPNKLSNNFNGNKNNLNSLNVFQCTKNLFSYAIATNISSYVLAFSFFYFLFSILFFIKCGYKFLVSDINKIIKNKLKIQDNNSNDLKTRGESLQNSKIIKKHKKIRNKNKHNSPPKKIKLKYNDKYINYDKSSFNNNQNNIASNSRLNFNNKNIKHSSSLFVDNGDNEIKLSKKMSKSAFYYQNDDVSQKNPIKNNKEKFNDYEKNTFNYEKAILYDERSCFQYYLALLNIKHPLLFIFGCINDYNSRIIKICIFILSFAMYYAINFEFFDEKIIHKIYMDNGKYDIIFFLPYISISFGFSHLIIIIVKLIFLSERGISNIRNQPTILLTNVAAANAKRNIKIKYSIFFILGLLFLGSFWLIMSSFGAIYKNTQVFIFENALMSLVISLVYPFFINILPCMFRMCSLGAKNPSCSCIYSFSKFLQIL